MLNKIYPNNWIKNLVGKKNPFKEIKNQYITDVFMFDDDFGEEMCGLVFSNGYLLLKGKMSPIGTRNADLFIFKTIDLARKKYN